MDPSTRRPLIGLGVVVLVVLALFFVSALHHPGDDTPGSGCSTDQRDRWRARLLRAEPVPAAQLGGCTTALGPFTVTGACDLRIAAADARSRRVVITPIDALEIKLDMDADDRPMKLRANLAPGQRKELFLGKDAQTITFTCLASSSCRARLE